MVLAALVADDSLFTALVLGSIGLGLAGWYWMIWGRALKVDGLGCEPQPDGSLPDVSFLAGAWIDGMSYPQVRVTIEPEAVTISARLLWPVVVNRSRAAPIRPVRTPVGLFIEIASASQHIAVGIPDARLLDELRRRGWDVVESIEQVSLWRRPFRGPDR